MKTSKLNKLKPRFLVGDKVFAGDKGSYYEAKVLKCESLGNIFKYFIHYLSWDRKYDTWLDEAMIEPFDSNSDINLNSKLAKSLIKSNSKVETVSELVMAELKDGITTNSSKRTARTTSIKSMDGDDYDKQDIKSSLLQSSSESSSQSKKRLSTSQSITNAVTTTTTTAKSVTTINTEATNHTIKKAKKELSSADLVQDDDEDSFPIKFNIPCDLKKHMADEWVIITQENDDNKRLLKLPCSPHRTVKSIIQAFLDGKKMKLDKISYKWTNELIQGLLKYFDEALPRILLYRQERQQYDDLIKLYPSFSPCTLYGGEHLLRLFVRLPRMLSLVFLPSNDTQNIQLRLTELLKFLHKHAIEYVNIHHYVAAAESLDTKISTSSSTAGQLPSSSSSSNSKSKAKIKSDKVSS